MRILLLGAGLQGQAALYDLVRSREVKQIIVADLDVDRLKQSVQDLNHEKVVCERLDVSDVPATAALIRSADAVIHLLPAPFRGPLAVLAVENGAHFIDASYAAPEYAALHKVAAAKGLTVLPEFGLDPGLDLVVTGMALEAFDEVHELYSYGSGIPEASAAQNALKYKISWSFSGVLNAYRRPARMIMDGKVVDVPADQLFAPQQVHEVDVDGVGLLEAYPNGDAAKYIEMLGLGETVCAAGRYSMRWPGHSAFWRKIISLGLLGDAPVEIDGHAVSPRRFLHDLLLPKLQYAEDERDIALIRVDVAGMKDGKRKRVVYQVLDFRDLASGLLAMQRTVGFTVSIGAQMILNGQIQKRGVLSPLWDVPAGALIDALKDRGIFVQRTEEVFL